MLVKCSWVVELEKVAMLPVVQIRLLKSASDSCLLFKPVDVNCNVALCVGGFTLQSRFVGSSLFSQAQE